MPPIILSTVIIPPAIIIILVTPIIINNTASISLIISPALSNAIILNDAIVIFNITNKVPSYGIRLNSHYKSFI